MDIKPKLIAIAGLLKQWGQDSNSETVSQAVNIIHRFESAEDPSWATVHLSAVELSPKSVIVIQSPKTLSENHRRQIKAAIAASGIRNEVLIVDGGCWLSVLERVEE